MYNLQMSRVFARKRLINESLKDCWTMHGIQYFDTENLIFIPILNKFTMEYGYLSVKIKECHPWRPPNVFFNGKEVITYYGELSNKLSLFKDFEKITKQKCLCCSSILCNNNWTVSKHIIDIKNEFQNIFDLRFRISQRFWAKQIASRFLVPDIPIDDFL